MNIQWFPGHMTKSKRQIAEKLKIIDLIIEVLDARAPRSTQNPEFDKMFEGKKRIMLLNKSDLAKADTTSLWLKYFNAQGNVALAFSCLTDNPKKILPAIEQASSELVERYKKRGANKTVRCMIAGIPNVGKSAILNRLAGKRSAVVGNKPGVTRGLQWIKLSPYLELMDTPGMLYPKIDDQKTAIKIAVLGSIREEILDTSELSLELIKLLRETELLKERYKIEYANSATDLQIFEDICKKRGFLFRGAEPDYERCSTMLLDEFQQGKMGKITLEKP